MYVSFALMYGIRLHVPSRHVSSCSMKIKYFHSSSFFRGKLKLLGRSKCVKTYKTIFCQFFRKEKYKNILMLIIFFSLSILESTACTHSNRKGHFRGSLCVKEKGCGGQNGSQSCWYAN